MEYNQLLHPVAHRYQTIDDIKKSIPLFNHSYIFDKELRSFDFGDGDNYVDCAHCKLHVTQTAARRPAEAACLPYQMPFSIPLLQQ